MSNFRKNAREGLAVLATFVLAALLAMAFITIFLLVLGAPPDPLP